MGVSLSRKMFVMIRSVRVYRVPRRFVPSIGRTLAHFSIASSVPRHIIPYVAIYCIVSETTVSTLLWFRVPYLETSLFIYLPRFIKIQHS